MTMIETFVAMIKAGGTTAGTRVFPVTAPDMVVRPYIIFQRVSANDENVMSGTTGLYNTRMQIDVYADTYLAAYGLMAQIDALMVSWTTQNVSLGTQDLYEQDVKIYRIQADYSIWHT